MINIVKQKNSIYFLLKKNPSRLGLLFNSIENYNKEIKFHSVFKNSIINPKKS